MVGDPLPRPWVRCAPLAGDASSRCYARVWDAAGRTAILVRYPQPVRGRLGRDLEVRSWFAHHGFRVPALIDCDRSGGWAVLEDLGEADAESALGQAAAEDREALAARSLEPLVALARIPPARLPRWNAPLDADRLRWELTGFELWFVRHRCSRRPGAELGSWLDGMAEEIAGHPQRICHRDYHLNNLFLLKSGEIALIDTQDVLVGPDTYDVASLLNERAMPDLLGREVRLRLEERWAGATGAAGGWRQRMRLVALQRALKVLGTFAALEAGGRAGYGRWLLQLAAQLPEELESAAAPPGLVDLLLDL